ncbi:CapA family protein [Oryzobacter telluris]|uniref:CapA family protein n=1 Tax=Oryzobacter telluris TaxID=3149179 RepID=UPI00370DAF20
MARHTHLTRDRRLIATAAGVFLLSVGGLAAHAAIAEPPAPAVVARQVDAGADGVLTLTFAGDTMVGDGAQTLVDTQGYDTVFTQAEPLLDGDVVIINAEGPITTASTPARPGAPYSYASNPRTAAAMAAAGVDVLGLGNNHVMDMGPTGLRDTRAAAATSGMTTFGAGENLAEAERPLLLTSADEKVAVVAFGEDFGPTMRSTADRPGMVSFSADRVVRGLDLAHRAGATKVIAMVHWGDNYAAVNDSQRLWGRTLADAGYDLVIGTGPHTTQPVETVSGTPVLYSLGNFVFGAPGRFTTFGQIGVGLVADVSWADHGNGPGSVTFRCLQTDNDEVGYVPRPCDDGHLASARLLLGPEVTWTGAVGTVAF